MDYKHLMAAMTLQADSLKKRAEWIETQIERKTQSILNAQKAVEVWRSDLKATHVALDALRAEYRKLLEEHDPKEVSQGG